jgi:3'(2'), 5'-bisphosphate nucleotidase
MAINLQRERLIAELAAQRATILTKAVQSLIDIDELSKLDGTPVSLADFGAQALIVAAIHKNFPDDKIVGEENADSLRDNPAMMRRVWDLISTTHLEDEKSESRLGRPESMEDMCDIIDLAGRSDGTNLGRVWTIDPVDGTKTFLAGTQYAVVIALLIDGVDQLGVIACPKINVGATRISDHDAENGPGCIVSAVRGHGAHIRQISAGALLPETRIEKNIANSRLGKDVTFVGNSLNDIKPFPFWNEITTKLGATRNIVSVYSSQLQYVTLALGFANCRIRWTISEQGVWDHAGGRLLFEECGGKVTDLHGNTLDMAVGRNLSGNTGLIATTENHQEEVLSTLQTLLQG